MDKMPQIKYSFLITVTCFMLSLQTLFSANPVTNPEKVYRYCYVVKTKAWYQQQERLWNQELQVNPQNEDAWYNYFFAARYGWSDFEGQTKPREALLDSIYFEMGKAIPDSWVYHYIHYYNYGTNFSRLEQAYQINPDEPDLYWEFIKHYELSEKSLKKRHFCKRLYDHNVLASGILNFNYNLLNSCALNSILIINGDNDTYPAWVLQEVEAIRPDTLVLNIHAIYSDRVYLQAKLKTIGLSFDTNQLNDTEIPAFLEQLINLIIKHDSTIRIQISPTVYGDYYRKIIENLYWTGLVYTYSNVPINTMAIHMDIIENRLKLDYLDNDRSDELHISESLVNQLNLNYIDPFIKLMDYYSSTGDSDSGSRLEKLVTTLAGRSKNE